MIHYTPSAMNCCKTTGLFSDTVINKMILHMGTNSLKLGVCPMFFLQYAFVVGFYLN